jgi:hypothetical protein
MFGSYPEPAARLTVRLNSDLKSDLLRSPPISSDLKSGDLKSEPVRLRFGEVRGIPFAIDSLTMAPDTAPEPAPCPAPGTAPGTARLDSRLPFEPSATALVAAGAPAPPPLPPLLLLGSRAKGVVAGAEIGGELHAVGSVGLPVPTSPSRSARRGRSVIA